MPSLHSHFVSSRPRISSSVGRAGRVERNNEDRAEYDRRPHERLRGR